MSNHSPIPSPSPSLIARWWDEAKQNAKYDEPIGPLVATKAAQWGADQELEACCELVPGLTNYLRAARRPKPPSLKEQALEALDDAVIRGDCITTSSAVDTIRRALEALDD